MGASFEAILIGDADKQVGKIEPNDRIPRKVAELVWDMVDQVPENRPSIDQVISKLEGINNRLLRKNVFKRGLLLTAIAALLAIFVGIVTLFSDPAIPIHFSNEHIDQTSFVNSVGMRLNRVEPGEFIMGSDKAPVPLEDRVRRKVRITKPFYASTFEVTRRQFNYIMSDQIPRPTRPELSESFDSYPVSNITYEEAAALSTCTGVLALCKEFCG